MAVPLELLASFFIYITKVSGEEEEEGRERVRYSIGRDGGLRSTPSQAVSGNKTLD